MRDWRKLHKGITTSDRLAGCPLGARWAYMCLLVAQDDAGRFPWTATKACALLSPTTGWSFAQCEEALQELCDAGLVMRLEDGLIEIVGGAEKNGVPDKRYGAFRYDPPCARRAPAGDSPGAREAPPPDKRREEKIREESPLRGSEAQAQAPAHTHEEIPAWLKTLSAIEPGKLSNGMNRSGVQANDTELIAWAEGKEISPAVLEEVADYVASAWHGQLRSRGRESVRATFQHLVNRELRRNGAPQGSPRKGVGRRTPGPSGDFSADEAFARATRRASG